MIVSISNPVSATVIFALLLFIVVALFSHKRPIREWFSPALTSELKGLAILMIVLSHIGYFLVDDHRFLWPLSIAAGVGVNLFLLLSGFGLTASQLRKDLSVWEFYKRRLSKIYAPFWLVLSVFFILDWLVRHIAYGWPYVVRSFAGLFLHADLYQDVNSPLWYLTFILGYYLLFPWVFSKSRPWLSAFVLYLAGYLLVYFQPHYFDNVIYLYKVHIIAFPLGVLAAWAVAKLGKADKLEAWSHGRRAIVYYGVLAALLALFIYANINSGIGGSANWEQWMSIIAALAIVGAFMMKKIEFRLLYWFGLYSYEIYLWHWPIMYRYDFLYKYLPAWPGLATALYLAFFIGLGWLAQQAVSRIDFQPRPNPAAALTDKKAT
ncbi:MAG: acyltransferase [Patescibacteria group bacterium]